MYALDLKVMLSLLLILSMMTRGWAISVRVVERSSKPVIAYLDNSTIYQQVFNAAWVEPSKGTNGSSGLIIRTQNCDASVGGECVFCGGSEAKASILTFAETAKSGFDFVDSSNIVFGPSDSTDSWGTEDPRIQYSASDELYYMFYTAYNGIDIFLSLATSPNPTNPSQWTRHGAVFPANQGSKSGALLLRESGPHFLLWGDHDIRIAQSANPLSWPEPGDILISPRSDNFDSKLVESGPPPLLLSNGDYLFFYNSAEEGWPNEGSAYNVGWVILDGSDPTKIKIRSEEPLLSPEFSWEYGTSPFTCNVPSVVFLEAARALGKDRFMVFYGAADATIGTAIIEVCF